MNLAFGVDDLKDAGDLACSLVRFIGVDQKDEEPKPPQQQQKTAHDVVPFCFFAPKSGPLTLALKAYQWLLWGS